MICGAYMTSTYLMWREDVKHTRTAGTAREIHIKDIITLAVWNDKLGTEFKKLKGSNSTLDKYVEAGNTLH